MAQLERFLFETEFERAGAEVLDGSAARDPDTVPLYTDPDMAEARRDAYEQGRTTGLDEARAEISRAVADAVQALGVQIAELLGELEEKAEETRKEAANLAFQIARTLAGTLLDREPVLEIEAVIRECLGNLDARDSSERLVFRVGPALVDRVHTIGGTLAQEAGYVGAIAVVSEDTMSGADCSAEWSSGGVERSQSAAEATIEAAVRRYIEARVQVSEPLIAEAATVVAQSAPAAPTDLHADSKAVRVEDPEPTIGTAIEEQNEAIQEAVALDADSADAVVESPDADANEAAPSDATQNTEGPVSPSDQ